MKRREYSTHIYPTSAAFQVFTPDEVRKLCVTKISTSVTFDNFGHPTDGGLYDKLMGPLSEDSDPCGTCLQNSFSCPGHFGYIDLVLPTVNPLFHKIVATIVKISCLSCFAIQLPGHLKHILALQMKLLKCDYISEALEIGNLFGELLETYGALEQIPEDVELPTASYEALVLKAKRNPDFVSTPTKTTEMLKNEMANKVLHSIKAKKICYFCKQPLDKIQAVRNKIIITKKANSDGTLGRLILTPEEARNILREIWKVEKHFLKHFAPILAQTKCKYPTDVFFLDIVPVLPPAARPVNVLRGRKIESGQSFIYKNILDTNYLLSVIMRVVKSKGELGKFSPEVQKVYASAPGNSPLEKMNNVWDFLQANVNAMLDHTPKHKEPGEGVRQIIEKKEGIIRMHMMGKRVNFAARSVITPDPNLNIDEIGIPEVFAKHLTYPVNVTPWNVEMLRKMVLNGPNVHPGAAMVELEDGSVVKLNPDDNVQRESIMKRLLTPGDSSVRGFRGLKKVYRHLCNGDVLLLNRQPTLHRPSIMAHTARILKGEKTLRLHYANCKAYNADFDGDEMNAHFPQGELARSEAYNLAHVCHQYLVPKDGTPLSGLIQDHMIAGVKLSIRGKFFSRMDYQQLVYQGLSHVTTQFKLLPPSIIKPVQLWSGKQVISTIIINILPSSKPPINLKGSAKISAKAWEAEKPRRWKSGIPLKNDKDMSEAEVVIKNGELLVGVLDKMHYGATPYGLVHCVYELYGGRYATKLLSAFTKLFTYFLQRQGFTLGVHDILVTRRADRRRRKLIEEVRTVGRHAMASALDMDPDAAVDEMLEKMEELSLVDKKLRSVIDRHYKSVVDDYTNRINKACLPTGLLCSFPENNLQLMVQSGAKGSTVNTMQISCLLGQIELEGKRPPLMISGKSLPSFPSFEFSPRAGGFIDGRFMTGIQPQEFFFHCMAGREGLIDTAVKTSRSGYLQRCLVKHLEGITVGYDLTVRDSDKSVIQFLYGEDGMDVGKVQFLNKDQLPFLEENVEAVTDKDAVKTLKEDETVAFVDEHIEKLRAFKRKHATFRHQRTTPFTAFSSAIKDKIPEASPTKMSSKTGRTKLAKKTLSLWRKAQENVKGDLEDVAVRCPVPVNSLYRPDLCFGSVNERLRELVDDLSQGMRKKRRRKFEDMVKAKAMESLAAPGEPVGLLAAQSIGEPSTQMTLNTFHFAGRGEMNVTLGIPRLREILMGATKNIKTPSMEIPFRTDASDLKRRAEQLCVQLTRVCLSDVLERIDVTYRIEVQPIRQQSYTLRLHFLPEALYKGKFKVNGRSVIRHVERKFFAEMFGAIRKQLKIRANLVSVEKERGKRRAADGEEAEDAGEGGGGGGRGRDSSDEASDDGEDAKVGGKCKELREGQELVEEEDREMDAFSEEEGETGEDEVDATMRTQDGDGDSDNEESKEEFHADKFDVIYRYNFAKDYDYDRKEFLWCELKFAMPLSYRKIDMTSVLKERAAKSVIWETPNIKRAITYEKDGRFVLRTDGININEMSKYEDLLDLKNLYSNDIHKIAETYGIEAARRVIVKEVRDVFNVYGIRVDPRHLLLIADYMTFNGTFEPLNRKGMSSSVSPMQQMSFESSTTFLKEAVIGGKHDGLTGPSGCLMVGKQCPIGTGCFGLRQMLPRIS